MSGFENGSITLDEERNIYYAGQVLSGKIEFSLSQPLVFTAITVEFHGDANVHWKDMEIDEYNGVRKSITVDYIGTEEYFNVVQCVCGGVGVSQLGAGSHSIPFRFQIPPTVPSNLDENERDGGISYYVKACLAYPDGREAAELEEAFEVVVPLDLNMMPEMKRPIEFEFEELISSCFCNGSGIMSVAVTLPATGFCPGQAVPIEIDADNQSSAEVHKIIFEIYRREKFYSQDPPSDKCTPKERLAVLKHGPIMSHTKRTFTCEMRVPDMIAPVLDNCGVIDVEFFFKVKLKLSGCNDAMKDEARIFLGFVPLVELTQGQYTHPMQSDLPKGPIPNLNAPPEVIQPFVYPSITLENKMQPAHVQNVSSYPGAGYHQPGNPYPGNYPGNSPAHAPYPGAYPYPGANPPYPGANSPPGSNPPYPGTSPPFPGANNSAPYPTNPTPFAPAPAPIGFTAPGYPPGPGPARTPSPYNPSAPSE